jgi:hypothetical protein
VLVKSEDYVNGAWQVTLKASMFSHPGDVSGDGRLDINDLDILADEWLQEGQLNADVIHDNKVDLNDFAVVASAVGGNGTVYYVDAVDGNDSGSGVSETDAWETLDRVNGSLLGPGDKVLFKAGTSYVGQFKPQGSGEDGKPIVIGSYGSGSKPLINGGGANDGALVLYNVEHYEIRNLEITNNARRAVQVKLAGFGTAHHIHLTDLYIHDVVGGIECFCVEGSVPSRYDDLLIENCTFLRTEWAAIRTTSYPYFCFRDNWFPSTNVVVRNNVIRAFSGNGIIVGSCDGALVEHNILRDQTSTDHASAGIWPWSSDNTVIQFNEVSGMTGTIDGQAFDSDWNCRNSLFQYNYSHDNANGFMLICNNGEHTPESQNAGNVGTVIRYNISQNDGGYIFDFAGPTDNVAVYNNVIYYESGDAWAIYHWDWGGWANNSRFYNNIFYTGAGGTLHFSLGSSTANIFEKNAFYGNFAYRPYDPNAITSNPMLIGPGTGGSGLDSVDGYKLQSGSVCIAAGKTLDDNGGRDYWGYTVPDVNAPDIGAHQFSE